MWLCWSCLLVPLQEGDLLSSPKWGLEIDLSLSGWCKGRVVFLMSLWRRSTLLIETKPLYMLVIVLLSETLVEDHFNQVSVLRLQ